MAESRTEPKFGHPTFNCNICFSSTQRTSQLCLNHSQGPCERVDADLGVLWIESEQILCLKVGCPNFGPVRGSDIYPINTANNRKLQQTSANKHKRTEINDEWPKYIGINTENHRKPPKNTDLVSRKPCVVVKVSILEPCTQSIW